MILLSHEGPARPGTIALFGVGLIGSAVVAGLLRRGARRVALRRLRWDEPAALDSDLAAANRAIARASAERPAAPLALVWSAGRAGFGAGPAACRRDAANFDRFLEMARGLAGGSPGARRLHLVSSAGGLFEGQRAVGPAAVPRPLRPYGELKLEQERRAAALPGWECRIYRPSAVVGPVRRGGRSGLVATMVRDGLRRGVTTLSGRPSTLRDFVGAAEMGRYIAGGVLAPVGGGGPGGRRPGDPSAVPPPALLAAARPSSIQEIRRLVERALGQRIYCHFSPHPLNDLDITYSPRALPRDWRPAPVEELVRRVALAGRLRVGDGAGAGP